MVKMTFNFSEETAAHLRETASRLKKTNTDVVREAIEEAYKKSDRMSDEERERKLAFLKEYAKKLPTRSAAEVDRELAELRESRRTGWRPGAR